MVWDEKVFGIVNVLIGAILNALDYAGLEIEENGARDVAGIVGLVEEDLEKSSRSVRGTE